MDPSSEILVDFSPTFRIYKDLRVERQLTNTVPAGYDVTTGVTSKDVVIDHDTGVYARLYLPDTTAASTQPSSPNSSSMKKLPVLIYYHGGGFVTMSAASPMYHTFLNALAAKAGALVVSVNYRKATEHPFPVGYEDAFRALQWVLSSSSGSDDGEPWLSQHGDLARVFLAGDSAGGNIAHNVAMMAVGRLAPDARARIEGVVLLHSAFWGKEPVAGEPPEDATFMEALWSAVCPGAEGGVDDPRMNPLAPAAPSLRNLPCKRMLVCAADGDFLRFRDRVYYEGVAASGWGGTVEWLESKDAKHCFFLGKPDVPESVVLMNRLVAFLAGGSEKK